MPKVVEELDDDAPDTAGATTAPLTVSALSSSAIPTVRKPVILVMANPPSTEPAAARVLSLTPQGIRTGS